MPGQHNTKVALFIDSLDPGGAETLVINLAKEYQARSIDVEIWHFGNEWLLQAAEENGLPAVRLDDRFFRRIYWLPIFAVYLSRVIRQREVSVIHSHLYGAVIAAAPAASLAGVRHVGTLHDLYSLSERRGRILGLRVAERLGTRIVCVALEVEKAIRERSRRRWRYLRTIHNGIALPEEPDSTVSYVNAWHLDETRFICVARLVAIKNIDLLIHAVRRIDCDRDFRVVIVGDGPDRASLERAVVKSGVSALVEFLGFRDDVDQLLRNSHCFVLPSRSEGLSCSIMEAMRVGIPVIATDVGGNSELVIDDYNGILVRPDNVTALVSAMRRVIDSRAWTIAAGNAAKKTIVDNFSFAKMRDAYFDLYRGGG